MLATEAAALRAAEIPAGVLWVQDWTGIRRNIDGGFGVQYRWAPDSDALPPTSPAWSSICARAGFRFLAYANPFVDRSCPTTSPTWRAQGLAIAHDRRHAVPNFAPSHPVVAPRLHEPGVAREYVKSFLPQDGPRRTASTAGWPTTASGCRSTRHLADGSDRWRCTTSTDRVARPGARVMDDASRQRLHRVRAQRLPGVQRVSQVHWVGDQEATFNPYDGLPTVVPAMLSLGLSGVPFVTHDIAGFSGGPSTKSCSSAGPSSARSMPIMRARTRAAKKFENWSWEKDAETTAHFRRFAHPPGAGAGDPRARRRGRANVAADRAAP